MLDWSRAARRRGTIALIMGLLTALVLASIGTSAGASAAPSQGIATPDFQNESAGALDLDNRGAAVAPMVPEVDEVLIYDPPWMKATPTRLDPRPDFEVIERLRAGSFDAAAIFTVYSQNPLPAAMLAYLAGIPLRLAHCRENPYQLLTDWVRETWKTIQPFARGGVYVNELGEDDGDDRVQQAYAENFTRLTAIKAKYDPGNLFRLNANIRPAL